MSDSTPTTTTDPVDRELAAALDELEEAQRLRYAPRWEPGRQRVLYPARVCDRLLGAWDRLNVARSEFGEFGGSASARKNGRRRAVEARRIIAWAIPKVPDPAKSKLRASRAHISEALR